MNNPYNIEIDTLHMNIGQKSIMRIVETVTRLLNHISTIVEVSPRTDDDMVTDMNRIIEESPYAFTFEKDGSYLISRDYLNGVVVMIPYSGWMSIVAKKKIKEYYDVKKSI